MQRIRLLGLTALFACQRAEPFSYPDPGAARTMIVVVGQGAIAKVYDLGEGLPQDPVAVAGDEPRVDVLYYSDRFEALGLGRLGVIEKIPAGPSTRSLPTPEQAFGRWMALEASFSPMNAADLGHLLETIQIPGFDVEGCLGAHRCVRDLLRAECSDLCEATPPVPPLPPAPVCPVGWLVDLAPGAGGIRTCRPTLPPRVACDGAAGMVQHRGASGCSHLGPSCSGRFAAALPIDALYVDPAAAPGGDGTAGRPFVFLDEALRVASAGATIALSEGRHLGPATIAVPGARLIGACSERTIIAATSTPALVIAETGVFLGGLSIAPAEGVVQGTPDNYPALVVRGEAAFEGGATGSIEVERGRLTVRDVRAQGPGYHLISVEPGAELEVDRLTVYASIQIGLHVDSARLFGKDLTIEGGSIGLDTTGTSSTTLTDVWIHRPELLGLTMTANDFDQSDAYGSCLRMPRASAATIDGLTMIGSGDPVVDRVDGVRVACKADLVLKRAYLKGMTSSSLLLGPLARFTITDLVVRDAASLSDFGVAFDAEGGSAGTIERAYFDSQAAKVVTTDDAPTELTLTDAVIDSRGTAEDAVHLRDGKLRLERIWSTGVGNFTVRTKERLHLEDLRRFATTGGTHIGASLGAEITRVDLEGAPDLLDVLELSSCDAGECPSTGFAIQDLHTHGGMAGLASGIVLTTTRIDRFLFEGHGLAALRLPTEVPLELRNGAIRGNAAVMATGSGDYRLLQMLDGVVVEDNDAIRLELSP